jgi:hypothetical protein
MRSEKLWLCDKARECRINNCDHRRPHHEMSGTCTKPVSGTCTGGFFEVRCHEDNCIPAGILDWPKEPR